MKLRFKLNTITGTSNAFLCTNKYTLLKVTASTLYVICAIQKALLMFKVSHSSIWLYQEFIENYINETCRQHILKNTKKYGSQCSAPPPSVRVFNLTFLLFGLKCGYWCIGICCQYFSRRNNYIKYCFKSCTTTRLKVLIN